jgi:hypothetical protein
MKNKVCPQDMHKIIDGYEKVVDNLNAHAHPNDPYPTAESLRSLVKKGAEVRIKNPQKMLSLASKSTIY